MPSVTRRGSGRGYPGAISAAMEARTGLRWTQTAPRTDASPGGVSARNVHEPAGLPAEFSPCDNSHTRHEGFPTHSCHARTPEGCDPPRKPAQGKPPAASGRSHYRGAKPSVGALEEPPHPTLTADANQSPARKHLLDTISSSQKGARSSYPENVEAKTPHMRKHNPPVAHTISRDHQTQHLHPHTTHYAPQNHTRQQG